MSDCIFCKIAMGEIPAKKVYEDEQILAFEDINPVAPVHILVIPKTHISSLDAVTDEQLAVISGIHKVIRDLAKKFDLAKGYRVVNNCGQQGGQSVAHLHFHLLGGRSMQWPPG